MVDLLDIDTPGAKAAVDFFIYRCRREIGSFAAALGGLDALVFTGRVVGNSSVIREGICTNLGWLGVTIDQQDNAQGASRISPVTAKVGVYGVPTDGEQVLACGAEEIVWDGDGTKS